MLQEVKKEKILVRKKRHELEKTIRNQKMAKVSLVYIKQRYIHLNVKNQLLPVTVLSTSQLHHEANAPAANPPHSHKQSNRPFVALAIACQQVNQIRLHVRVTCT
uniref:Uncharacterized protein n=1 Tax=Cacopsylla melanoneura TaxID=428564 RepID=A0A8D9FJ81_9HEMI